MTCWKRDSGEYVVLTVKSIQMPDQPTESDSQPSLDELIPLSKAAELSGLSQGHLSLLIRNGEMWGIKIGRNWVTTDKAVREYLARNRRPGPKPKK
ncbi:MAG: helix-turn-helix domain-containing protein [Anaerolineales bacterium]|nr:helix-turn-helix domain-containing protein [Anaerolineales bacterium]